jgi:uncharacterized protein DUF3576
MFCRVLYSLCLVLLLSACSSKIDNSYRNKDQEKDYKFGSITDGEGFELFSTRKKNANDGSDGITVNALLWHASLEALDFAPLASTDPRGGVIMTEWYTIPTISNEQFKIVVYIKDRKLRADALKVNVFKRVLNDSNEWTSVTAQKRISDHFENKILQITRKLKNNQSPA